MIQLDQLGSLDNPKLAPKFSRHFTVDLFLATKCPLPMTSL